MVKEEGIIAKDLIVWAALALALLLAASAAGAAQAQAPTPEPVSDDQVNAIARQLYCPVCENIPLDACGTQACSQWRALIREKLALGWNQEQIEEYFAAYYGDRVLAEPPRRGLNWLVYLLPPAFFLGGAYVLFRVLRGLHAAPAPSGESPAKPDDPYVARFEEQVRKSE